MATSGSFNLDGNAVGSWLSLKFSWSQVSQSIADNTTTISWKLVATTNQYGALYKSDRKWTVVIDGTTYTGKVKVSLDESDSQTFASGTAVINHANDGTKTFTCTAEQVFNLTLNSGKYLGTYSGEGEYTLDRIPRAAKITTAPNFNDEANPTIDYSNPAGNVVTTLQACISLDGTTDNIAYRNLSKTGTSYTFELTEEERNVLRNATTTANSRRVTFIVKSVIGGVTYTEKLETTLTIVNANPVIEETIVDTNAATIALTGSNGILVANFSNAQVAFGDSALKGADIVTRKVTCGNKTLYSDGTMNGVESGTFTFVVTDTRDNATTKTVTMPFVAYVKTSCSIGNEIPDAVGNMTVTAEGSYFNGSFGAVENSLTVQYRKKVYGGMWGDWANMGITLNGNAYTASAQLTGLDEKTTYVFQTRATDRLMEVSSAEKSVKATPVFDWGKEDFVFNVPVDFKGGAWSGGSKYMTVDALHPVGSVVLMYDSTSPAEIYGGTWELFRRSYAYHSIIATNTSDPIGFFTAADDTTAYTLFVSISGNTLKIRYNIGTGTLSDSTHAIGTINFSSIGITGEMEVKYGTAYCDGGNVIVMVNVANSGVMQVVDIVGADSASGNVGGEIDYVIRDNHVLNTPVDCYYWRRTA